MWKSERKPVFKGRVGLGIIKTIVTELPLIFSDYGGIVPGRRDVSFQYTVGKSYTTTENSGDGTRRSQSFWVLFSEKKKAKGSSEEIGRIKCNPDM